MNRTLLSLFHIFIVSALFLYVGVMQKNTPKMFFWTFIVIGTIIILYHSYELYQHILDNKSVWVNLLHIITVGPVLIYIGILGADTKRMWFEILLMLGFASFGYHGYYLGKNILFTPLKN